MGSVYSAAFAVSQHGDGEYYVVANVHGVELRWPECAQQQQHGPETEPCATQTVVVAVD